MLTRQRVGQVVRGVATAAGITKRVYPHLLRYTVATRLLSRGRDITDLQRFLGHESITTTRHYAETTAATLKRKFDALTDPAAHELVTGIRRKHGDDAALLAAELLTHSVAPNASVMLVHELNVLALAQPVIDATARKRLPLRAFAGLRSLECVFQAPPSLVVVKNFRPALEHNRTNDVGHCAQVLKRVPRPAMNTAVHETGRVVTILGRTRTATVRARL